MRLKLLTLLLEEEGIIWASAAEVAASAGAEVVLKGELVLVVCKLVPVESGVAAMLLFDSGTDSASNRLASLTFDFGEPELVVELEFGLEFVVVIELEFVVLVVGTSSFFRRDSAVVGLISYNRL